MAAVKTKISVKLQLVLAEEGTDTKTTSFSRIKSDADADALYAAGSAIADLQSHALSGIRLGETYELTGE